MAEIKQRRVGPTKDLQFQIEATDPGPIVGKANIDGPKGHIAAIDRDGQLVHNGVVVSGPLAINAWYAPFLTSDGHLRVRREDGHLEPYLGPDAVLEEPVQVCGREESGVPGSACVLPVNEHGTPTRHVTAAGQYWTEPQDTPTGTCKAALMIKGEYFPCDWQQTNADGKHNGWNHTNKAAEAVWSN